MTTIAERVARGAALLDAKHPGWHKRVDLHALDMRCFCIIHQVYDGAYNTAVQSIGLAVGPDDMAHGFLWRSEREIPALEAAWRELIESRRAAS